MLVPIQMAVADVDEKIRVLGNLRADLDPPGQARVDAMILVLGDRLLPCEIHERWKAHPQIESGALLARAWLIGDLDELPAP